MEKLTKEEKHKQCVKEIKATLIVVGICFLWHVLTAFLLNSVDWTLFHMPAWFVVSVLGTVVIAIIGVFWLLRFVFVDFSYEEDAIMSEADDLGCIRRPAAERSKGALPQEEETDNEQ